MLRLKEAGDANRGLNQQKFAQLTAHQNRGLDQQKARDLVDSQYKRGLLGLKSNDIDLKIKQLESLDFYRKGSLDVQSQRVQHQIDELKGLNNYRKTVTDERVAHNRNMEILGRRRIEVERESIRAKLIATEGMSDSQQRLRLKDSYNAEQKLLDPEDVNSLNSFNVANDSFLSNTPDSTDRFYIWDDGAGLWNLDGAEQIPFAKGKTMGHVRRKAAELGISLQEALNQIYEASK